MRVSYSTDSNKLSEQPKKSFVHKKVVDRLVERHKQEIEALKGNTVELAQTEDTRIAMYAKRDKLQKLSICALALYPLLEFILRHGN